jgi:hypothetical protein
MNLRLRAKVHLAIAAILILVGAAARADVLTNELSKTIRLFNGRQVDLKPLVEWYRAKLAGNPAADEESRPLKGWRVVRIERVITANVAWTVQAEVDGEPETLLLRNPPQRDLDEFNMAKSMRAQLLVRTNQLQQELRRVAVARRQAASEEANMLRRMYYWRAISLAESRMQTLAYNENVLERALAIAESQLQLIEARGWDFEKPFSVECFALKTAQTVRGQPVYDRGQTL